MTKFFITFIFFFFAAISTFAETRLPLETFRAQGKTNHCWAYSAAHVLQSRSLLETSVSSELNVENELYYWVLYNRFFHRYKVGSPLTGLKDIHGNRRVTIPDENLGSEFGMPQEFFDAFLKHGHAITRRQKVGSPTEDAPHLLPFLPPKKSFDHKGFDSKRLAMQLDEIKSDAEADRLIRATLDPLFGKINESPKLAQTMLPQQNVQELKLVSVKVTSNPKLLHQWDTFSSGMFTAYYVSFEEAKTLIRESLKQGWGTIVNTDGPGGLHSWAAMGVRDDEFAAVDSRGMSEWRKLDGSKTESVWMVNTVLEQNVRRLTSGQAKKPAQNG